MKNKTYIALIALVCTVFCMVEVINCVDVLTLYPRVWPIGLSNRFWIEVQQRNATKHRANVFMVTSDRRFNETHEGAPNRTISWMPFAFSGSKVTITVHTLKSDFQNCTVRPKSYGYKCVRIGTKAAQINITHNTQMLSVEFDNDYGDIHTEIQDKLLIFADAPETNVPKNDSSTLYFGPGFKNLNGQKRLESHIKTVYLAPGALVMGGFITTGGSVRITGRGMLVNTWFYDHHAMFSWSMINMDAGSHHIIEGITLVDPSVFYIRALSPNLIVRNVKTIAPWIPLSDGIETGDYALIEDSFIMANDDSIKIYNKGMTVRRSVIWQAQHGAVFQLGWWPSHDLNHIRVSDIDIIHTDWCTHDRRGCKLGAGDAILDLAGESHHLSLSDMEFKNIRIEGSCPRLINFKMHSGATGNVTNVRLMNWTVDSQVTNDGYHNQMAGSSAGSKLSGWNFYNLKIGGKCITSKQSADLIIDSHTTSNIHFSCTSGPSVVG